MNKFLTIALMSFSAATWAQTNELVVSAFGGAYTNAIKAHIAEFERANDVRVKFVPGSGADALAKAKAKQVDVVHADMGWANRGEAQGVFEELEPAKIPNLATTFARARFSKYGVITNFGQYGIAYNPKLLKAAPTSWQDLLNPAFKGHVTTAGFDFANVELLVLFAKQNGGGEDNLEPGFKVMEKLGQNVSVFYSQHPQLLDLFRSEDVWLARWLRGRVDWANKEGGVDLKFVVPKEGAIGLASTVHVVKGTKNKALAMAFVNYLLSKNSQTQYAVALGYTPARADLDPKTLGENVPYGEVVVNSLLISDWKKLAPNMDQIKETWEKRVVH
ncbi:ABC transporter substrate-binding protein [Verminephrobacter aporrectodeae subsp. tuberculatae]|uniref:ABC transporter substrate-binding protein n=1 Tax=Verminephrobacter aporrectodeae TaxID=1110389 RepID=UPI0022435B2C|nr:ABC transporter substrate-binding protein [Verminephrobacter aporrectodeae]MCW8197795.1 ABC transporter substrate-binding protein [Verminephrobacter aporrectodeae subsp. tuberculatae]